MAIKMHIPSPSLCRRRLLSSVVAASSLVLSGCFPRKIETADLRAIRSIDVVPSERTAYRFSYSGSPLIGANPAATLGAAAGSAAAWQRRFEDVFRDKLPDFFGALDDAIVRSLRAKGYRADMASAARRGDARFSVTFSQIGVGFAQSFDGRAIVPHASMIVRVVRTSDERALAVNGLLFGGGGWGTIPKLEAPPELRINTIDEFFADPVRSGRLLLQAADIIAPQITKEL